MELTGLRVSVVGLGKSNIALVHYLAREGRGSSPRAGREERRGARGGLRPPERTGGRFPAGAGVPARPGLIRSGVPHPRHAQRLSRDRSRPGRGGPSSRPRPTSSCTFAVRPSWASPDRAGRRRRRRSPVPSSKRPVQDVRWREYRQASHRNRRRDPREPVVVLELSSFQLELVTRSPRIAVITNISPNHLDVHASMAAYVGAKSRITCTSLKATLWC